MIAITTWMEHFLTALHKTFGDRISFIGLQGSYALTGTGSVVSFQESRNC